MLSDPVGCLSMYLLKTLKVISIVSLYFRFYSEDVCHDSSKTSDKDIQYAPTKIRKRGIICSNLFF